MLPSITTVKKLIAKNGESKNCELISNILWVEEGKLSSKFPSGKISKRINSYGPLLKMKKLIVKSVYFTALTEKLDNRVAPSNPLDNKWKRTFGLS